MSLQQLLDNKEFWKCHEHEFMAIVLDFVKPDVSDDRIQFWARLYLQHMRAQIERMIPRDTTP